MDESIHAWVQVSPQKATGSGCCRTFRSPSKTSSKPAGLATEYGSPIYKGRIGTADAAIVRELRSRGGVMLGKTHTRRVRLPDAGADAQPARSRAHTGRQLQRIGRSGRAPR